MSTKFHDITRNALSLTFGQGLGYVINFLSFILIARYFNISDFGKFSFFVATISIVSKFVDFGLVPIVFREYSLKKNNKLLNTAFSIRGILFILAIIIVNLFVYLTRYSHEEIIYINILLISIIVSSRIGNFRELMNVPFKVNLKMHIPMLVTIIDNIIFLLLVLLLPLIKGNLPYLIFIYVFANIPGFIIMIIFLSNRYHFVLKPTLIRAKWLLMESLPLAGFVLVMVLFQQVDLLLLKYFKGENDVAIFSASLRFVMPLSIIPAAFSATVFPLMMKNISNHESQQRLIKIVNKFLFLSATIISLLLIFKTQDIILLTIGNKYVDSYLSFNILLISQIFLFVNFFSLSIFTAYKKQIWNFHYSVIIFLANAAFDIILIPALTFNGAAAAKLAASLLGFIFILQKIYKLNFTFFLKEFKIIIWIIFLLILGFIISFLPIIFYFIAFICLIMVSVLFFNIITLEEIEIILKLFNRSNWLFFIQKYFRN